MWQWHALTFVFAIGATLYTVHAAATRLTVSGVSRQAVGLIALAGVLSYVGNLSAVRAVALAPNPGYANAVVGLQAVVITAVSLVLFNAPFSPAKVVGVLLCVAGVTLVVI
jgi:hypothetical protein